MHGFPSLSDDQMIEQFKIRRQGIASVQAGEAADMLDYVDRTEHTDRALHELSLVLVLPVPTIERQIARARRIRNQLPTIWQAWHDGYLTTSTVDAISHAATRLDDPASLDALDGIDLDHLGTMTPGQCGRWLDRWVERTEPAAAAARHDRAYADRNVTVTPAGDGMARLTALLAATDAAAIQQKLTNTAHGKPAADPRTLDQARADLAADLLLGRNRDTGGLGYQAVIGITVPLSSLMGFSNTPGELTDRSATIPAHIIREAARDPKTLLYRLVTDDIGNLMTASWLGRFSPTKLNQVLDFRDGTSRFPTSSVPASACDTDHTNPWPAPTNAANTGPLNRRAHNLKTNGHITLQQTRPGQFDWTTHTGHTYRQIPEPLPIAPWH